MRFLLLAPLVTVLAASFVQAQQQPSPMVETTRAHTRLKVGNHLRFIAVDIHPQDDHPFNGFLIDRNLRGHSALEHRPRCITKAVTAALCMTNRGSADRRHGPLWWGERLCLRLSRHPDHGPREVGDHDIDGRVPRGAVAILIKTTAPHPSSA